MFGMIALKLLKLPPLQTCISQILSHLPVHTYFVFSGKCLVPCEVSQSRVLSKVEYLENSIYYTPVFIVLFKRYGSSNAYVTLG